MADESDDPGASGRAAAVGPGAGPEPNPAAALATAQALLERGDYGQVLRLLEPLAALHRPATAVGAELRLLQATALIGQGRPEEAAACCRALRGCADPDLRARARELQQVLEAPALERPRDWSLQLPDLGAGATLEGFGAAARNRRARRPPPPPPPPVGPTRAPYGFAALPFAALLMVLLAPIAAALIQAAISRSREFEADASAARLLGTGEPLARALERLDASAARIPSQVNPAEASAYIVNPLRGRQVLGLFSTHPPAEDRIARLRSGTWA